eukprot:NODE_373_length_8576_cov_0.988557.p3 type:complete len:409 gc:universal NODE_373_length_8576_cov_0.988557:8339-7113(-)
MSQSYFHIKGRVVNINPYKPQMPDCYRVYNIIFSKFENQDVILFRCDHHYNMDLYNGNSSIKFIISEPGLPLLPPDVPKNKDSLNQIIEMPLGTIKTLQVQQTEAFNEWYSSTFWQRYRGAEDPRIFQHQNELYLYYTNNNPQAQLPVRGIEIMKFRDALEGAADGLFLQPHFYEHTNLFGGNTEIEKNWLLFSNESDILALYSLNPFIMGDLTLQNDRVALYNTQFKRQYSCFKNIKDEVHFSSNVITINYHGELQYLFVFNIRNETVRYITHFAMMQNKAPFHLTRISKYPLKIDLDYNKFEFISGLNVRGKSELIANEGDVITLSGGIDDDVLFEADVFMEELLDMEMMTCESENREIKYFNLQQCDVQPFIPSIMHYSLNLMLILVIIHLWIKLKKQKHFNKLN